jgi:hypothetical protein
MQLVPNWDQLDLPWSEKIAYLTVQFLKLPQTECPVKEIFEKGLYIREMTIPAETLFLGRTHTHGHEVQLLSGSVIHITPEGRRQIDAPFSVHTTPGYQMVAFIITDVVCRSIHPNPTESRDGNALENDAFGSLDSLKELGNTVTKRLELWQA